MHRLICRVTPFRDELLELAACGVLGELLFAVADDYLLSEIADSVAKRAAKGIF